MAGKNLKTLNKMEVKELESLSMTKYIRKQQKPKKKLTKKSKEDYKVNFSKNKSFKEDQSKSRRKYQNKPNYDVSPHKNVYKQHLQIIKNLSKTRNSF